MATFTQSAYRSGIAGYRRYVEAVRERPLLQASLFLVLSLMLLIVLIAAALRPTLITIAGLAGQIDEQANIERQLDAHVVSLTTAQQNYQQVQSRLALLDQAIPTTAQFTAWSQIVDLLAANAGIEVINLNLSQIPVFQKDAVGLATYTFSVTARGEFVQLKNFLTALENTRRLASLESVQITRPGISEDSRLQLIARGLLTLSFKP